MDERKLSDPFEKLKLLLSQDSFELLEDFKLVYLMNDAVECFLVFQNARMTGNYLKNYEGELEAELSTCEGTYVLVIRQGDSVCTLFFEDLTEEVHLYDYGDIGHFWVKGYEYLRQLEYKCAIIRDKCMYMGEEYCTEDEIKLAALAGFPPLNVCCYPAVPEKYLVVCENPWVPSEESFESMYELLEKIGDYKLLRILRLYQRFPLKWLARYFSVLLHRWEHKALVDELYARIRNAARTYPKRHFSKDEQLKFEKLKEKGYQEIKRLKDEGYHAELFIEEPFENARDAINGKVYVMVWKKHFGNCVVDVNEIC